PLVGTGVAELAEGQPGLTGLHPVDRVEYRLHSVGRGLRIADEVEPDERVTRVLAGQWCPHRAHKSGAAHRTVDGGCPRPPTVRRGTVHEYQFAGRRGDSGVRDDSLRTRGITRALLIRFQLLLADHSADQRGSNHE